MLVNKNFFIPFRKHTNILFIRWKFLGRERYVKLGTVSPERIVPANISKPVYYYKLCSPGKTVGAPEIKTPDQIIAMKKSGKLAAQVLAECEKIIKAGVTTDDIDAFVHERIIMSNAYPSPLRYAGFPKSVCTSVNNVACHGIPDDRALLNGDIINVDITVFFNGYHADCSKTFMIGNVEQRVRFLVESTEECLTQCINICQPGVPFNKIGCFISEFCKSKKLAVIPSFIGHGIGTYFHGPPEILHYANTMPGEMKSGMTFTIEPILSLGKPDLKILKDGWTAVSEDGAWSAQFEHTILINKDGAEILTRLD